MNLETICRQWEINKLQPKIINPKTGKEIKKNGPTYNLLEEECKAKNKSLAASLPAISHINLEASSPPLSPSPAPASPSSSEPYPPLPFPLEPSKDPITLLLQMVLSKKIQLDPCTLVDKKSAVRSAEKFLLQHASASPTENIKVKLNFTDGTNAVLFLKIWPNVNDFVKSAKYAGVDFERKTYEYITKNILIPMQSPNFIPFLGYGACPLQTTKFDIRDDFKFDLLTKKILTDPKAHLNVLITGSAQDILSINAMNPKYSALPESFFYSIVFQTVHALYCLKKHGISHMDFHTGNILIETLKNPMVLEYTTNALTIKFKTKHLVKIFDFDQAYSQTEFNNLYSSFWYRKAHAYPDREFNPDRDLNQIICGLLKFPEFKKVVKRTLLQKPVLPDLLDIMNRGTGRKFVVKISKASGDALLKEPVKEDNGEKIFDILLTKLQAILTQSEFKEISQYKDFPIVKSILFSLQSTATGYEMVFNEGWMCQLVHQISDKLLYRLEDLFTSKALFDQLTENLSKSTAPPHASFKI